MPGAGVVHHIIRVGFGMRRLAPLRKRFAFVAGKDGGQF
jgi:hypothetical protein